MRSCKLAFTIEPLGASSSLTIQVKVDQTTVFDGAVVDAVPIEHVVLDDEGSHELTISLLGKTNNDTKLSADGNIIEDAAIKCSNFTADDVDINQLVTDLSTYTHDFNGNADGVVEKFYGIMGCNGTVRLEFSTPIYIWILENS